MRYLAADVLYTINTSPVKGKVIVVDTDGLIVDIVKEGDVSAEKVERFAGSICPGFINTHCHLELSYMKGKIESGGGLHHFIKEVEKLKKPGDEEVQQAIKDADSEMSLNGIVAVGDICNTPHSFSFKNRSALHYHNFIEVYAFDETRAEAAFDKGSKLQHQLRSVENSSVTPHAPYSASKKLLKLITQHAKKNHS